MVSQPRGSASAVGAGFVPPPAASIDRRHPSGSWTVACADTGIAKVSDKTMANPESVYLIIGRLPCGAHHQRLDQTDSRSRCVIPLRYAPHELSIPRKHGFALSRERAVRNKKRVKSVACGRSELRRGRLLPATEGLFEMTHKRQ